MSLPLILRPEAEQDLATARDWYDGQRVGLGSQFLSTVDDVFAFLREWPESHVAEYRGVRRVRLHRFPYVVYYRLTGQVIEVLAVLHGSRSSRVWRSRA